MNENINEQQQREYVICDDSGDPGVEDSSMSHFIIAAVIVVGEDKKEKLTAAVDKYRKTLGWKETHEFKFNTTKKSIIEELITRISDHDFSAYAMVLDKRKIPVTPDIISSKSLYYYVMKELLIKLDLENPYIIIDGISGKRYMQDVRTYLRKNLKTTNYDKFDLKFADSRKNSLIQIADIIAGSVARLYRKDRADSNKFYNLLESKIVDVFEIEF